MYSALIGFVFQSNSASSIPRSLNPGRTPCNFDIDKPKYLPRGCKSKLFTHDISRVILCLQGSWCRAPSKLRFVLRIRSGSHRDFLQIEKFPKHLFQVIQVDLTDAKECDKDFTQLRGKLLSECHQ